LDLGGQVVAAEGVRQGTLLQLGQHPISYKNKYIPKDYRRLKAQNIVDSP
jgi:hypothetical protein